MTSKYKCTDNSKEAVEYRAKKHNCDGLCYGPCEMTKYGFERAHICSDIDVCPETRSREFLALVAVGLTAIAIGLAPIIWLVYEIIKISKGG